MKDKLTCQVGLSTASLDALLVLNVAVMADVQVKRKITVTSSARIDYAKNRPPSRPASPTKITRPASPTKSTPKIQSTPATPIARPRAKISSSANVGGPRKPAGGLTPGYVSGTSTPRAPSPTKQLELKHGRSSPQLLSVQRMRSRTNVHSNSNSPRPGSAASSSSQLAQSLITAAASDSALVKTPPQRVRHASISSISAVSSVSAQSSIFHPPSPFTSCQDSDAQSTVSSSRIRAKVSGLAKAKVSVTPPLSPSPSLQTASPNNASSNSSNQRIGRTPSVSSLTLTNKEPLFYPITTASPAANVHRFATVRSPTSARRPSNTFIPPQQTDRSPTFNVDPALIPLPPLSPPSSTLSFSSHSSASRSSISIASHSTAPTFNAETNGHAVDQNNSLGSNDVPSKFRSNPFVIHDLGGINENGHYKLDNDNEEEKTTRAEAKSNRKIADLEITNKSLLAINAQLEATKHKQAKEIRELRRKLRESRLILPPRTYRALRLSSGPDELGFHDDDVDEEDEEEEDEEADTSAEITKISKEDEIFMRVRERLDNLLESGRRALETKAEDFAPSRGGTKVLHEVEARTWRDGGLRDPAVDDSFDDSFITAESGDEAAADFPGSRRVSRARNEESIRSEEEVEVIIGDSDPPQFPA